MNIIAVFSEMHEPGPYVIREALKHCLSTCGYKSGSEFRSPACDIESSALLQKEKLGDVPYFNSNWSSLAQTFLHTFVSLLSPTFIR